MARIPYTCQVCGKELKLGGAGNIRIHEESAYHLAAVEKGKKKVPESINEPAKEPNITGIQTTVPEGQNDTNKDTSERTEDSGEDSAEWDGFLC